MKKFILFFFALVASVCAFAQGTADFYTLEPTSSYKTYTTTDGWVIENGCVQGGTSDPDNASNPHFPLFGESDGAVAACINGKTTAVGTITSPVLEGGCGILSLNYAYMFSEKNGVSFHIAIVQNGAAVAEYDVVDTELAQYTAGSWSQKVAVPGDFQIVITNNCPSQSTSNKDRWSIWNLSWTAQAPLPESPLVFSDVVDGGVYAIVNVQPLDPVKFFVLESVNGELTAQSADKLDGNTKYAETAQYKAIELEDGRFAFQNVATGDYLAWRNHDGKGGNGNCGFNPEINEMSSWTMNDGTVFDEYRTYWFYTNWRSETTKTTGSLIIGNDGKWNGWGNTECKGRTDFSNNYGFVACATEVDFTKVNVASVAEEASEAIDPAKWYLVKQHRGGVSPIYDNGGNVYRAKSDNVVAAGVDAADVVDYLVHFVPAGEEDVYNIQFANGRYFADGTEATNSTQVKTTEEEPGLYNVKYILDTPGHFGIYAYDMGAVIDNNGLGNTVVFWGSGEISDKVDGNNDFKIYEVEFAPKTTAAADLKELIKEAEAAYAANNVVVEVGEGIITSTDQFSSEYTDEEEGSLANLLDGDGSTFWHSTWHHGNDTPMHVHYLQVEFAEPISGDFELNMNRRVNNGGMCQNDNPVKMSVETSVDGVEFVLADEFDTPFTQTGAAPLVQAVFNIPTAAKYLRFFADECNGGNNRGYWHCGDFQIKPIVVPAPNAAHAEAAAAFAEALAAAKACGANATDADVAALQAAYAAYVAALSGTVTPEPTPVTFEFTDNEDGTITVTPSDLEALYFFNIYSDRTNAQYQLGTDAEAIATDVAQNLTAPELEAHTGVNVVNPAEWIQYWFGGGVQYTPGDYRLGVVALNWDGTYTMAGDPVFHAFTKAESQPVVDEDYALNFAKDLVQNSNDRHVTGFKLNDQEVTFPEYNTVYLDATNQVIEVNAGEELQPAIIWDGAWMHGIVYVDLDNDGSFYEDGDLVAHSPYTGNQNLATSISTFTAPAKAGEYRMRVKTDWVGDSQTMDGGGLDPAGRIGDDGTMEGNNSIWKNRGRIIDLVLKVVAAEPEVTFPEEGKAYVVTNNDSNLYLNIVADDTKAAVLTAQPEKIFFEKKGEGWLIKDEEGNMIGGHAKDWNVAYNIEQIWNVAEVEGGYAFQRADAPNKYLGFDKIEVNPDDFFATAGFRDKNYATAHGVFTIAEYTFPLQHTAYKVKNVDAGLYMNITSADAKNVTIEKTPQEIFFTVAEDGGFYIQNKEGAYIGAGANDWTVANTPATWNVVEVEGGYAFQRTDATNKYLGLDSVQEGSAYFRDKGAAAHYAHIIMLFDTPETTPAEDLAAAIEDAKNVNASDYANVPADLFEDLAAVIEKAKDFANEDAAVSDINDQLAAIEAAINAIKNYVPETAEELLARLQAAVAAGKAIVKDNTVEDKCMGGLPGYKALDLVLAVASDVEAYDGATEVTRDEVVAVEHNVKYYNEALPCIPEVGKTYIIRNHPTRFGDAYSYVITAGEEGRELIPYTQVKDNVEDKHLWTVSEHVFKVEDDWGDLLFSETRYVFTNVATGQIFGYNGAKLDLCEKETDMNCWYFTQKTPKEIFAGSTELPYGTLGLQYNDGGNKYKYTTVDMRVSDLNISGSDVPMHALWNTYSSAFIFDVYEPEVTEWDGAEPTVAVADATNITVTFNEANSVEATNFGVLAAVYDEQGDVYAIAFNSLFDDSVEFGKDCATIHFKKISDIRAELAESAKAAAAKISAAVGGADMKGKVVIAGKSFKVDGNKIYDKVIVADLDVNGGNVTGIEGISFDENVKVYDLQGRRIAAPRKGLQISNGVKVVR